MADFFNTYGFLLVSMTLGAMLGLSLYLPLMAGQLSLASPGFYALGGYVAAIISTRLPLQSGELYPLGWLIVEIVIAGAFSALLGLGLGLPVLRLRGIYLAIATIAFVEVLRVLALNLPLTGGAIGIFGIPQPFRSPIEYLWVSLPLLLLTMVFLYRLEIMRAGRAMDAIRTDELAAASLGINPMAYKLLAFTLGAVLAGMVGALSAHFLNTWNARQGTFDAGILYLTAVLIGGNRTFLGPVLGGMIFTALPEVLRAIADQPGLPEGLASFLRESRLILYGTLIVLGSVFFPYGLVSRATTARLLQLGGHLVAKAHPKRLGIQASSKKSGHS